MYTAEYLCGRAMVCRHMARQMSDLKSKARFEQQAMQYTLRAESRLGKARQQTDYEAVKTKKPDILRCRALSLGAEDAVPSRLSLLL